MEGLDELIARWKNSTLDLRKAEGLINLLIVVGEQLEKDNSKLIEELDHWEGKATELANDVGSMLDFEVGEHSNINCPVQNAIDEIYRMGLSKTT